jgi:pyruvate kinase
MHQPSGELDLQSLRDDLVILRTRLLDSESTLQAELSAVPELHRESARNLIHYLALRRFDVRDLQRRLAFFGLSSLGRAEAQVLSNLDHVLWILERALAQDAPRRESLVGSEGSDGRALLRRNTDALLGPPPAHRLVRIMVTMPGEAASDYPLVRELVARGMDCMRINCAHDDPSVWARIAAHLERARREVGHPCRLLMDLSGPKLRTGEIKPGPQVVKWRPSRNCLGRITAPARIWLTPSDAPEPQPRDVNAVLPVPGKWLAEIRSGSDIRFTDARGKVRTIRVRGSAGASRLGEAQQTAYVTPGVLLQCRAGGRRGERKARVGTLPPIEGGIPLAVGDTLILTRAATPGEPARHDRRPGALLAAAHIPCMLPEVFPQVKTGERIWFDDGKIGGVIRRVRNDHVEVEIVQCAPKGSTLRSDKGVNLPDSDLRLPALTPKDVEDLGFVVAHADLVGLSFVQRETDVEDLRHRLHAADADHVGIILKIETRRAFERLSDLALAALQHPRSGIMIARGDLAVECGYERLAEVQEEILWVSEAAHLPVIWATQVLESLAKTGQPSRAEITDAAMGERAECVMLNKGPHILRAVQVLDDILRRMQFHQVKKTAMLRKLHVAEAEGSRNASTREQRRASSSGGRSARVPAPSRV